ncbi:hypothetical protein KO500_08605 [Cellulophaga baltica]|uniref:DUF5683 domain-containing protein n=1 Tax=Cellulophaga TaxID=104264 RepID=UPI001C06F077|nr:MULTISPECIES: DUF5683 domain-containing protein [Cellulophaga]MBU2996493.1 hypothetical protein [Cellulophaga baltica]MDO6767886.1 DUF5683 domain-containing protein [Cellulophaga sp. 1_MG-2023]
MVNKKSYLLVFFFVISFLTFAQENEEEKVIQKDQQLDSIQGNFRSQGIMIEDSIFVKQKTINPLSPAKAAFYSAVIPGLGQAYNKSYWKIPIVIAALGTSIYAYDYNNKLYQRFRTAYKRRLAGFTDDEFYDLAPFSDEELTEPEYSTDALQSSQEKYQEDRDLMLLVTIGIYVLNIIDANVDAHLKQFNVDDNLSVEFQPYLNYDQVTSGKNIGMALTLKF